jgi:hypothetical protein
VNGSNNKKKFKETHAVPGPRYPAHPTIVDQGFSFFFSSIAGPLLVGSCTAGSGEQGTEDGINNG